MRRRGAEQRDAGCVRVSTDMQVERDTLQNQGQALESYVAAHGLNLRLYEDKGSSAKDTDRPDLQRLIADIHAGRVRSVLGTKLDRVSRSRVDLLELLRLFEGQGVKLGKVDFAATEQGLPGGDGGGFPFESNRRGSRLLRSGELVYFHLRR